MKRITHLTSAHPRYDTRIFIKECQSLAKEYEVNLVVADSKGDEVKDGVNIYDVGKLEGRFNRIFKTTQNVYKKALELNSDLYHFHDPELLYVGLKLHNAGKKVIFDIHEDTANQIKNKFYIPKVFRYFLYKSYTLLNNYVSKKFYLVLAEKSYARIYEKYTNKYITVQNLPDVEFLKPYIVDERRVNGIFYIGGVSNERGLLVTIEALKILKLKKINFFMHYIGPIYDTKIIDNLDLSNIENDIKFYGSIVLNEGFEIAKECKVGLSILEPIKNYTTSYSTKIFEYMSVSLPVITSNFKLYQDVIEVEKAGFCIDPYSAIELSEKIEYILTHNKEAKQMGENGKRAVLEKYNWHNEEVKLLKLYKDIL